MKIFFKILIVCVCFIFFFSLLSCNTSIEEMVSCKISETRENFYYGKKENNVATFTDGRREENYVMDGVCSKLVPYGVIVLWSDRNLGANSKFVLSCKDKSFSGEFEVNPFDGSLVADIGSMIGEVDSLLLNIVDANLSITLENLSESWLTTCSKALNIFTQAKKNILKSYVKQGDLKGEIYIKIVSDKRDSQNIYYYVLFVGQDSNTFATLIDVHSAQIVQS